MKASEAYEFAVKKFTDGNIENPRNEADFLLNGLFSVNKTKRLVHPDTEIDSGLLFNAVEKRLSRVPLQYIIGKWSFYGFDYAVGQGVLIPRPETELLVDRVLKKSASFEKPVVYDLCAGTGCIGLTLARLNKNSEVYLFEKSRDAFNYLSENANGIENARVINEDIFLTDCQKYKKPDIIVSNPPYVPSGEINFLQAEVGKEPSMALDGGDDGLDFYRLISEKWIPLIADGGFIAVECGENQSQRIEELFSAECKRTYSLEDYNGIKRFVFGEK